jgi:hypothetical protein
MKKTLSVVLSGLLLLSILSFSACAEPSGGDGTAAQSAGVTDAPESETEAVTQPQFEFRNYGGDTFTVYMKKHAGVSYSAKYMLVEDDGSVCDEAVKTRNLMVEDKFNIKLEFRETGSPMDTVGADLKSGDPGYDLILECRNYMAPHAVSGVFADFSRMNIDFGSRPWWDINCVEGYSIDGRLFLMANDVSVSEFCEVLFLFFNKQIVENFHLSDPYALEAEGEWTLDNFLGLIKGVSEIPADGSLGTYGLMVAGGSANGTHMNLLTGCGVKFTGLDGDRKRVILIDGQIDKIDDIYSKVKAVTTDDKVAIKNSKATDMDPENSSRYKNYFDHARALFTQRHFLFLHASMSDSSQFSQMEDDYGVIVNPKYNRDQADYYHRNDPYAPIFAVPNSPSVDLERLALIMDYWAYVSRDTLIPAYYDITIKTKRVSDPIASEMVDRVRATIMYEMGDIFGLDLSTAMDTAFISGQVARAWAAYSKKTQGNLDKLNASIAALE